MARKKKSGKQERATTNANLFTAILNLVRAVVEIIRLFAG